MLPKPIVHLNDADDGLCNSEYLVSASANDFFSTIFLDETYGSREYGMVVPSRNVQRDTSTVKSQADRNESQRQGEPFSNK